MKDKWLQEILPKIQECSQHTFPILSKKPEGFGRFSYPENVMLGATVTNEGKETLKEMTGRPNDIEDWKRIEIMRAFEGNRKLISFEPLLGPLPEHVSLSGIDWVIIGALSKGRKHVQPKKEWVSDIVSQSKNLGIPVFLKPSLGSSWKGPLM